MYGVRHRALRGLRHGFVYLSLRRCRAIIHVVSGASRDPVGDFRAINQELALFSEALAMKPQVYAIR